MNLPLADAQFDFTLCIESRSTMTTRRVSSAISARSNPVVWLSWPTSPAKGWSASSFARAIILRALKTYSQLIDDAGFDRVRTEDIGPCVYDALYRHVLEFNHTQRSQVTRYWSLVLSNYR